MSSAVGKVLASPTVTNSVIGAVAATVTSSVLDRGFSTKNAPQASQQVRESRRH